MKKLILLAFLVLMALIVINRQRVFVRDPIATVYRNDVKRTGVQVFINYSDDVLLAKEDDPGAYRILIQNWNKAPGTPAELKCIRWMACLTNADRASIIPMVPTGKGNSNPQATMTDREVSFVMGDGAAMRIELR